MSGVLNSNIRKIVDYNRQQLKTAENTWIKPITADSSGLQPTITDYSRLHPTTAENIWIKPITADNSGLQPTKRDYSRLQLTTPG